MVKRAHHRSAVRHVLAGTIGTLGALAVSTQVASANHVIVKAGDTVWKIAQEHHATVSAIENANANTIKKVSDSVDLIYAGQQLTLPGNDTTMQADENGRYTVKPGDTLSEIAQNFHVSVATLMAWNGLTSNQLYIGQQLIVNGQGATVTPAASVVNAQTPVTNVAPVASVASETDQEAAPVVTDNQAPVQSASADQQVAAASTSTASSSATDAVTSTASVANANSTAPASASNATQMVETATTNSASGVVTSSQANMTSATASASTVESNAAAFATSDATATSTASTTTSSVATSTATVSAAPVSTATTSPVSTTPVSTASATTPVSAVTSTASASVAPAPTTPASANTNVSAAPQPVASQAVTSASQAPVSQATSQAPAQSQAAATTTPAQPQSNASQDLHSGSVVSLAVKIANTNSVPYVWGGSSLSGMDCSGLVDYVYANAEGKQLPHNTVALESCVNQHAVSEAQPGDILFWGQHGATYHCAIYTGNNQFVAAAKPGTNVASYTISPYFEPSFAGTVK